MIDDEIMIQVNNFYHILSRFGGTEMIFQVLGSNIASDLIKKYSGSNRSGSIKKEIELTDTSFEYSSDLFGENDGRIGPYIASVLFVSRSYGFCQ